MATWKTGGSMWSPKLSEGTTESQDSAWGEEADKRRSLSATEDEFSSKLKTWSSNLPERDFWETGEVRRDSTPTASAGETKLLKISTAWDRWRDECRPKPDEHKEEMNAADEWRDNDQNPRPPLLGLSWTFCHAVIIIIIIIIIYSTKKLKP